MDADWRPLAAKPRQARASANGGLKRLCTRAREDRSAGKCLTFVWVHSEGAPPYLWVSPMPPRHRFAVGQTVVAPVAGPHSLVPRGPYVITRLLPIQDGEPSYRVRSEADGHERALRESQLRAASDGRPRQTVERP